MLYLLRLPLNINNIDISLSLCLGLQTELLISDILIMLMSAYKLQADNT